MGRKKKLGKLASQAIDEKYMGENPPTWEGIPTQAQLGNYYNWMTYFHSVTDDRTIAMLLAYLKAQKRTSDFELLARMPGHFFVSRSSVIWNAHALHEGLQLDPDTLQRFNDKLAAMIEAARNMHVDNENKETRATVQDHIKSKACDQIATIDATMVDVYIDKRNFDTDVAGELQKVGVTGATAKHIIPYYQKQLDEIEEAISSKDEDLREGYSSFTKPQLRKFGNLLREIVTSCGVMKTTTVVTRKKRTPKIKTATELVKKIKYKQSDNKYKLTSINPSSIVGSQELWIFNTTYRTLGVLRASDPSGLTMKGTTVLNFDEKTSMRKKVRKPEVTLPEFLSGGKVAARKTFEGLSTGPSQITGRINGDIILLRAFK